MNEENIYTEGTFLSLIQDLLENRDPEVVHARLEELKQLMLHNTRAQQARYVQLLRDLVRVAALEELVGRNMDPVSRAALSCLERLEVEIDDCRPGPVGQNKDIEAEDLTTVAAHIDTADSPEIIRSVTIAALCTIERQEGALERKLYCAGIQRLLEEKMLTEEMRSHSSRALSLWDSLRRIPVRAMAISLLWYDEARDRFRSAAPEDLVCMDTMEELKKGLAVYEKSIQSSPLRDQMFCQRELCRSILRQAGVWLMEEGLDREPLFRSFTRTIRQYLWGELDLLKGMDPYKDNLIPPLVRRLSETLGERNIQIPPVLSTLLRLCVASAEDYDGPVPVWVLEEDKKQ